MLKTHVHEMCVELEMLVAVMAPEYSLSTIETLVAAVQKQFGMKGWGSVRRQEGNLKDIMRGVAMWRGRDGVRKVKPVEAAHVAQLVEMDMPESWRWAGMQGWRQAVAIVCLMWVCGLRPKEAQYMSACDLHWYEKGAVVAVNRTKNDREGYKRRCDLEFGSDATTCLLRVVRQYVVGAKMATPGKGCTQHTDPTLECEACPRLFENVLKSGVIRNQKKTRGLPNDKVNEWVKATFLMLEGEGLLDGEDTAEGYTARGCRAGAVSASAAEGLRMQVAAEHFRMRSEQTLLAYDRVTRLEKGAASRALQKRVDAAAQSDT